jgi:hypothetical protein
MSLEPYKDRTWLYEHYVRKRMNMTDIVKLLKQTYNIEITPQGLYNWCKKYELLRFRGKGRNLSSSAQRKPQSPMQAQVERRKREQRRSIQARKKGYGK